MEIRHVDRHAGSEKHKRRVTWFKSSGPMPQMPHTPHAMANPIPNPISHPTYDGNEPTDSEVTNDTLPTFYEQPDAQPYDQSGVDIQMGDPEELLSIRDLCNDIIGERTFRIESEDPVDYYQEALESLRNGEHKFFTCRSSSEELGIETVEGLTGGAEPEDDDETEDETEGARADEDTSFGINLPGIDHGFLVSIFLISLP